MSALLSAVAVPIPRRLVLDPPLSDAELFEFCQANELASIERTREGVLLMNPPAGSLTSDGNAEVISQLRAWWKTHRRGRVYDCNAGFHLADGSMLSPNAAYLSAERLATLSPAERRGFPHVCPDFVIELLSRTDRLSDAMEKMERWIENGAQLAWLIDPYREQVHVYSPGQPAQVSTAPTLDGVGPVAGWTLDLAEIWSCYQL